MSQPKRRNTCVQCARSPSCPMTFYSLGLWAGVARAAVGRRSAKALFRGTGPMVESSLLADIIHALSCCNRCPVSASSAGRPLHAVHSASDHNTAHPDSSGMAHSRQFLTRLQIQHQLRNC